VFGGPAGTATFNLADWGEVSGTPDQKGNELFGFAPILSKEDESTFTLTGAAGDGPNFTQATITGGTLLLDAATLTMASGADPLLNDTGGILQVRGNSSILGHLTNHGTITLQDGIADDILTVSGNYRAGSRLLVDVDLSANTADRLVVTGDATGRTDLEVVAQGSGQSTDTNANGQWDTGEGILVVEVQGQSPADAFVLVDTVTANGFTYNLYYDSATGNWYLSSLDFVTLPDGRVVDALLVSPKSPLYRSLYVNMRGLTRVAGLFDRIRGRLWRTGGVESGAGANFVVADNLALSAGNGLWIDLDASRADLDPKTRYAGTAFTVDRDTTKLEIGYDHLLWRGAHGGLVGGISAHYGEVNADIKSVLGKGSIDTEGYGFGLTGT